MQRREFIALSGTAAVSAVLRPGLVRAQAMPEIGILNSVAFDPIADRIDAFFSGLESLGFVESQNVTTAYRSSEGVAAWLPPLALDLVRRSPKAIVCMTSANTVRAAAAATSTIPIVFAISGDPVELGLVANRARPEANVTGAARVTAALNPERLKVVCQLVPPPRPVAFLLNSEKAPGTAIHERVRQMEEAARAAERRLVVLDLAGGPELGSIFATMTQHDVGAFVISTEALFGVWRDQVIGLSARHGIAAMFPNREYVFAGGLVSYGADLYEHYRVAGAYTGRILKGETCAELPVQIPTKFEMVINLKTARALGLNVPLPLLDRADELIE
jgi:putative ABC transport system substrate-binding protein